MSVGEHRYTSDDGLSLYYRDYGSADSRDTVLCLPGLTRNSRDFHELALHLADRYRVVCADPRGRGMSDRDPDWRNYSVATYVSDINRLMDVAGVTRAIFLGTSMGGLISMTMAYQRPECVKAIILNDIGPEADPAGIGRILRYVGRRAPVDSWSEAVDQLRSTYAIALPDRPREFWEERVRMSYREGADGKPEIDMDLKIGGAIRRSMRILPFLKRLSTLRLLKQVRGVPIDAWDSFRAVTVPCLVMRGELSDILSEKIVERMQAIKPDLQVATIPDIGHSPYIEGPAMFGAIETFLAGLMEKR
jgi:pimeloyl-ACP methyl ester carboxylesterase